MLYLGTTIATNLQCTMQSIHVEVLKRWRSC